MEIILLERVENLGQMGDLVKVKSGYARNYLLPQGKALRATADNRQRFETERATLEAQNLTRRTEAEKVAAKMEDLSVSLIRAASEMGQLYGSASANDVAQAVTEAGFTVIKSQIDISAPIKTLGLFPVRVTLHPEVAIMVMVNIARSDDEASEQLRLGRAIVSDIDERERIEAAEAAQHAEERAEEHGAHQAEEAGEDGAGGAQESSAGEPDAGQSGEEAVASGAQEPSPEAPDADQPNEGKKTEAAETAENPQPDEEK